MNFNAHLTLNFVTLLTVNFVTFLTMKNSSWATVKFLALLTKNRLALLTIFQKIAGTEGCHDRQKEQQINRLKMTNAFVCVHNKYHRCSCSGANSGSLVEFPSGFGIASYSSPLASPGGWKIAIPLLRLSFTHGDTFSPVENRETVKNYYSLPVRENDPVLFKGEKHCQVNRYCLLS